MFCDGCGTELQESQRFCSSCGKAVGIAMVRPQNGGRVSSHLQLLGILWTVYSFFTLIAGGVLFVMANTFFVNFRGGTMPGQPPMNFLQPLLSFVGVAILCKALLGLIAGIGLLQRQHWARMIAIVAAFLALISIPFGTALGIYTIFVLMSQNAEREYAKIAPAA
jgi:hypothetical protein